MKLVRFLPVISLLLLSSSAVAQFGGGIFLPPNGGVLQPAQPDVDPVVVNIVKSKSYSKTLGFSNANIQMGLYGNGTVFVVDDESGPLARATANGSAFGVASLFGCPMLGGRAEASGVAQNKTWNYSGQTANVQNSTPNVYGSAFLQVGPWVLLNNTKSYVGDAVFAPSWANTYTRNVFNVSHGFTLGGIIPLTVHASADANATLYFTATLDPIVTQPATGWTGSKAKLNGAAVAWCTATAGFNFGIPGASVGMTADMRLADTSMSCSTTADNRTVTGSIAFAVQPLALVLRFVWSLWPFSGTDVIWSWSSALYSANYSL